MSDLTLTRTRSAFSAVSEHISQLSDPQIESFLVQQLTVIFYAEMELKIGDCVKGVFTRFTDGKISTFLTKNQASIIKRINKSDIVEFAKSFGEDVKTSFDERISDQEVSFYSNIIGARHKVGHGPGVEVALIDIRFGIEAAEKILAAMDDLLKD